MIKFFWKFLQNVEKIQIEFYLKKKHVYTEWSSFTVSLDRNSETNIKLETDITWIERNISWNVTDKLDKTLISELILKVSAAAQTTDTLSHASYWHYVTAWKYGY